jgi:hypothetical protein
MSQAVSARELRMGGRTEQWGDDWVEAERRAVAGKVGLWLGLGRGGGLLWVELPGLRLPVNASSASESMEPLDVSLLSVATDRRNYSQTVVQ